MGIHLSLHESCGNLHRHRSSAVCLNEEFFLRVRGQYLKKREVLIIRVFVEAESQVYVVQLAKRARVYGYVDK